VSRAPAVFREGGGPVRLIRQAPPGLMRRAYVLSQQVERARKVTTTPSLWPALF